MYMRLRGLNDASDYNEYGDYVPASNDFVSAPYTGDTGSTYTPIAQQLVTQQTTQSTSANGSAPTTSSSEWLSLLKQGVATYGNVQASKNVAPMYRAPAYYPPVSGASYSPFPALLGAGSAPLGKLLLIGLGALILLRR